jgi:hypothetical protein
MANASYRASGYCHGGRDQAAVLIYNAETAVKRTFVVHNFFFREAQPYPVAATLWNVYKTTAQSDGEALGVLPLDSSSSALPSQVQIATNALVTQGSYVFGRWLQPTNTTTIGTPCIGGMSPQTGWVRTDASTVLDGRGFSDTQEVVLREGEGLAFMNPSASDSPQPAMWQLLATIRVGSATYAINTTIAPIVPNFAAFGMFNGTGSGVVVEVLSIQLTNIGQPTITTLTTDAPVVRLARVFGGFDGGVAITPVTLGGASVPSQLQVLRNQDWSPLNVALNMLDGRNGLSATDLGIPGTTIVGLPQQRQIGVFRHFIAYTNNLFTLSGATTGVMGTSLATPKGNGMFFSGGVSDVARIRLNPGEGLAFIVDNNTSYGTYWFEAEITHEPPQVSGTSPMGYSS